MASDEIGLAQALSMFQQGVKDFATTKALQDAHEQVQQIKMSGVKESDQRLAMGQIAQSLVSRMAMSGASAAEIQQVSAQYAPKQYKSADEAILDLSLRGDEQGVMRAIAADEATKSSDIKLAAFKSGKEMEKLFEIEKLRQSREEQKARLKEAQMLKSADIEFETNAQAAMRNLNQLKEVVSQVGNYESDSMWSFFSNSKAAAKLAQDLQDTAIAYAKIVDPTSVAREGEVEAAKKYSIPAGPNISNDVTLAALTEMEKKIASRQLDRRKLSLMTRQQLANQPASNETQSSSSGVLDLKSKIKVR
jgi:hypothetical protein